jgi:hypothetical protein
LWYAASDGGKSLSDVPASGVGAASAVAVKPSARMRDTSAVVAVTATRPSSMPSTEAPVAAMALTSSKERGPVMV